MSNNNGEKQSLLKTGIIVGVIIGLIIGVLGGYYLGVLNNPNEQSIEEDREEFANKIAAGFMLSFNERIENTRSNLRSLCNIAPDRCDTDALDTVLIALDSVKIDESTILELILD